MFKLTACSIRTAVGGLAAPRFIDLPFAMRSLLQQADDRAVTWILWLDEKTITRPRFHARFAAGEIQDQLRSFKLGA